MLMWVLFMCCSPFEVEVSEEAGFQKVRAWGPGLETGMVGKSADFVVEAIGTEVGTLGRLFISNITKPKEENSTDTRWKSENLNVSMFLLFRLLH